MDYRIKLLNKYASRVTPSRALVVAAVIVLLGVYLWPHTDLTNDLVFIASIPGAFAALVFGLTFWHRARVQIGRLQLKYKTVRRIAGTTALVGLSLLLIQRVSIGVEKHRWKEWRAARDQYYMAQRAQYRFNLAFTHLQHDEKDQVLNRLTEALSGLDKRLAISTITVERTLAPSGDQSGVWHIEAAQLADDVRADAVIWGKVGPGRFAGLGPVFDTDASDRVPLAGAYLPSDFTLPELAIDDFCEVLRLVAGTESALLMIQWHYDDFDNALEPLIKAVRTLADDTRKRSAWTSDTRARIDFLIGVAMRTSGYATDSRDTYENSVAYLQRALGEWTREDSPLEWAMTQLNLGFTLEELSQYESSEQEPLQRALDAYDAALKVYQAHSDKLDSAAVQVRMGSSLHQMSSRNGDVKFLQRAIESYRAAISGFSAPKYAMAKAAAQHDMARALFALARETSRNDLFGQAIAADRAALTVYKKGTYSWFQTRLNLAEDLAFHAVNVADRKDLQESVEMSREVLSKLSREDDPELWAWANRIHGVGLEILGNLDRDAQTLLRAGAAFQAALSAISRERDQVLWVDTKEDLGSTYMDLGSLKSDPQYMRLGVEAYDDASKSYSSKKNPAHWAWTKSKQGMALTVLGRTEGGTQDFKASIACYREALSVLPEDKGAEERKLIQKQLDRAIEELRKSQAAGG